MRHDGCPHRYIIKFSFNSPTVYLINQEEKVYYQWQGHGQLRSTEIKIKPVKFYSIK